MSFAKDYQEQRTAVGTVLFQNGNTNDRDLEFADYVIRGTSVIKSRGGRNLEEVLEGLKDGSLILYEGERMASLVLKLSEVILKMEPSRYYDVTVTIQGQMARIQGWYLRWTSLEEVGDLSNYKNWRTVHRQSWWDWLLGRPGTPHPAPSGWVRHDSDLIIPAIWIEKAILRDLQDKSDVASKIGVS